MSKGISRSSMQNGFEGKRVIVAACAAIAMVMGAMSVGASVSNANQPRASVSTIATAQADKSTSTVKSTQLSNKHTLEVRDFLQQQNEPLYTTPKAPNTPKDSLAPALGLVNPVLFMAQIVQMQQPPAQTATSTAPETTTPAEKPADTSTPPSDTPTDITPPPAERPTDDPTPPTEDPTPQPQSLNVQATDPNPSQQ